MAKPTTAAVVAFAKALRERAAAVRSKDVWAKPYSPSDSAAYKLSQRHGPETALGILQEQAAAADRRYREDSEQADRARKRLQRFQAQTTGELKRHREKSSHPQRIANALASLSVIGTVPAARLDSDRISGTSESGGPAPVDSMARASLSARLCAEFVEAELDEARNRILVSADPDRDVRLRQLVRTGLSPTQISIVDPSQGPGSAIARRIKELGLF